MNPVYWAPVRGVSAFYGGADSGAAVQVCGCEKSPVPSGVGDYVLRQESLSGYVDKLPLLPELFGCV